MVMSLWPQFFGSPLYATGSNTVQHSALRRIRGSTKDRANSSQLV